MFLYFLKFFLRFPWMSWRLYEANVPIKTRHIVANQTPWLTTQIMKLINERNTAHVRWRKFKTPELRSLFQNCRRTVVKSIEQAKKLYYQRRFSSAIDSRSKWKGIRNIGIGKDNVSSCHVDVNSLNHMFRYANIPSSYIWRSL